MAAERVSRALFIDVARGPRARAAGLQTRALPGQAKSSAAGKRVSRNGQRRRDKRDPAAGEWREQRGSQGRNRIQPGGIESPEGVSQSSTGICSAGFHPFRRCLSDPFGRCIQQASIYMNDNMVLTRLVPPLSVDFTGPVSKCRAAAKRPNRTAASSVLA